MHVTNEKKVSSISNVGEELIYNCFNNRNGSITVLYQFVRCVNC